MAGLTERLPLTDGTNRILDDPAGPSLLGSVADFAADTLSGFVKIKQEEAVKRRQRKEDEDKAREQEATVAAIKSHDLAVGDVIASGQPPQGSVTDEISVAPVNEASGPADLVFGGIQEIDIAPDLAAAAKRVGTEVINVKAAVEQGRMPPISMKAALSGRFNALIDQYPDQAEHILDIWKKMGIDTALFRQGRDTADQLDEDREAGQRSRERQAVFEQEMFEMGAKAAGDLMATAGANGGAMTREEVIAHGLKVTRASHDFELQKRGLDLQLQQATLSKEQRTQLEGDRNTIIGNNLENAIYNTSNPVVSMVQNLANSILKEPDPAKQAQQWQAVGTRIHAMIGNQVEHAVQLAIAGGYTGDTNTLRTRMTNQFKRVEDLFTGEFSVAQTHIKALQTISAKMKIDGAEALPLYTTLKDLGMDPATMTGFINGIQENSDLQKRLRQEIKGFTGDFGRDRASDHMLNIVKLLRGEETLAYMSPGEARDRMLNLYNVSNELSKNYYRGLGGNPDMVLNGIGEVTIAANSLTPSSSAAAHNVGAKGILANPQVQALKKLTGEPGVDKAMVTATIQAARAGGAHILNDFQAVLPKLNRNPHFKAVWDANNGKYKIDDSGLKRALRGAQGNAATLGATAPFGTVLSPGRAAGVPGLRNAKAPEEMARWVEAANVSLDGIMALAEHDPSTPKGSPLELRNYYGRNIAPKSLRQEAAPIDVDAEINKQFEALERTIDTNLTKGNEAVRMPQGERTVTGVRGQKVSVPPIAEIESQYGSNPIFQAVRSAAAEMDVPVDIATRLAYVESRFTDHKPNSAGAQGPMQVVGKIHDAASMKIFGKPISELTPQENVRYGLGYLRKLYEQHGSWNKAIQRYLGRGDDGNLRTEDYAALIE